MTTALLFDGDGREVALGRCLGRGGEGTVYAVGGRAALAAKVYSRALGDGATRRKLEAMIALATPALAEISAWPQQLLLDAPGGSVVGFLMPRVERHRPLHSLYGPAARKRAFPRATWAFLARAARNVAAAFETVHAQGHVIGDVNPANIAVSARATVRLMDCDSFQVTHEGRTHPCGVGLPLFTPPELQRRGFDGLLRTRDHDDFGLAVVVFHLLFMGRHPFAGCRPDRDVSVESAIRSGVFVFGGAAAASGWAPPPFSLRLADLPPDLALLFERALATEAGRDAARPAATEWVRALEALEGSLTICRKSALHAYVGPECPWCRIEAGGGPSFFSAAGDGSFDAVSAWQAAEAVESPGPAGPPPVSLPSRRRAAGQPLPQRVRALRRWRYLMAGGSAAVAVASLFLREPVGSLGLLGGLFALRPSDDEAAERFARRRALQAADQELRRLCALWERECGETGFLNRRREIEKAKRALDGLAELEEHERRNLAARVALARQKRHLRRHALAAAAVPGVTTDVARQLAQCGIETADDVDAMRLARVHGLEPPLRVALVSWRQQLASSVAFDPLTDVREGDRRALTQRQQRRRESLARVLQAGAADLRECREAVLARRREIGRQVLEAQQRLVAARADLRAA